MRRSIRQMRWVLMGAGLVLAGATAAWAQNTYPWPSTGNVGIGTTSPSSKLHIATPGAGSTVTVEGVGTRLLLFDNEVAGKSWSLDAGMVGAWLAIRDVDSGTDRLVILNSNGYVGIGTTTPGAKLDVNGDVFIEGGNGAVFRDLAGVGTGNYIISPATGQLSISTAGTERVRINSSGNVGIGTTSPGAMLHVAGNAQVDGNIAAKYQDVAEWVRTSSTLSPGTVVAIDTEDANRVVASHKPYDTRVAGVVSAQPAIILGEPGEDRAMIAHTGRVRVKVDANFGSIAVGDLLVTSPTLGYAMRSEPVDVGGIVMHRPGTLIGKALEPLNVGQGEILVLLMLQ